MDKVKYIAIYIKCDGLHTPYRVLHKYNEQNIVYNHTFEDIDSANLFLKELYEKVEPGFLHYNYTMPEYNAKSKDAYFFNRGNDSIKNAYEYDGLAEPVYNLRPLKKAYRELFGKKLNLTESKIRQKRTTKQKVKEFVIGYGIAVAVASPVALLMYEIHDMNIKLQQVEERAKRVEEMEKKVQELESKTINKERARQNKIDKEVKKHEKTLPQYNEYLQTQKQIQNYRDSLNQAIR